MKYETRQQKWDRMISQRIDEANDYTSFENGARFDSEKEVRAMFDIDNPNLFSNGTRPDDVTGSDIDNWANAIVETRTHCNF